MEPEALVPASLDEITPLGVYSLSTAAFARERRMLLALAGGLAAFVGTIAKQSRERGVIFSIAPLL
jgi:hypothetical protein